MNATQSMTRVAFASAPLLLVVPGCGSRSALLQVERDDAGVAGGGAVSGGGGSSSGGAASGGSAGAGPCHALLPLAPTLSPANVPPSMLDDGLRLTTTSDDGARVTAVFVRKSPSGKLTLRHASLQPWQDWPANGELAPVHTPDIETVSVHVLARSGAERWATAVRTDEGLRLYRHIEATQGGPGSLPIALPGIEPSFLASGPAGSSTHLVGTFDVAVEGQRLGAQLVDAAGETMELPPLGCANGQPPRSDAVPFGQGWLVAHSRHEGVLKCPASGTGPPGQVDVLYVSSSGLVTTLASMDAEGTVVDLHVATHPLGAYVVWSIVPSASEPGPGLRAVLVNGDTGNAFGPFTLGPGDESGTTFTAGAIGSQLAVAERRSFQGILVSVFDEAFTLLASVTLGTGAGSSPTALLGSPDGSGVLLGWTQSAGGDYRVHLTRLDCAP